MSDQNAARQGDNPILAAPAVYLGFALVGWSGLLLPSMVRSIKAEFGISDAAIGLLFFAAACTYALSAIGSGFLEARFGRRRLLVAALGASCTGLAVSATGASWALMVLGAITAAGLGSIEGLANGVVLDLGPTGRSRRLNLLHFTWSGAALCAPLAVGTLLDHDVPWRLIFAGTSLAAGCLVVLAILGPLPPNVRGTDRRGLGLAPSERRTTIDPVLVWLGIGISCYVGSELGISNWLVRFLTSTPTPVATAALSLFWGGLTLSRLVFSRLGEARSPIVLAASLSSIAGLCVILAAMAPVASISIVMFALAGFALGPIVPSILAAAGARHPTRSVAVSGLLVGVSLIGAILYPPVMGLISDAAGLVPAMLGAGLLAIVCSGALAVARYAEVAASRS